MYPWGGMMDMEDHILCAVSFFLHCTIVHIFRSVFLNTWFNASLIE